MFQGSDKDVKAKWDLIVKNASQYGYAEQASFSAFVNWPNSKYQMPGDIPFNNSNAFVRDMVSQAGITMFELNGSHPGENSPSPVPNVYGGPPWRKGQQAPPMPTSTP